MKKFLFYSLTALAIMGCKCAKTDTKAITGQSWELSEMNGAKATAANFGNGMPTITFSEDNKVSGKGGCNGYGGEYTLSESGNLTIGKVISTKMYCEGVDENEFMAALSRADKAFVKDGNLVLAKGDSQLLVFVPGTGSEK